MRGDVVESSPLTKKLKAIRIEFGDTIEAIAEIDPLRGRSYGGWIRSPFILRVIT